MSQAGNAYSDAGEEKDPGDGPEEPPPPQEPIFTRYRRTLPHWRLQGATYFVTWRLQAGQPDLSPLERDAVVSALLHFDGERYELFAFVVMNDHVHVLVRPAGKHRLEQILHSWKSFTARHLQRDQGRVGAIWQEESFDRIVRSEEEFWEKGAYILDNARRRWPDCGDYLWVWLRHPDEPAGS